MAFNPFKNKKITEPEIEEFPYDEDVLKHESVQPVKNIDNTPKTPENNMANKSVKYNLVGLEATNLVSILTYFGSVKIKDNNFTFLNNSISIKENKWYDSTLKKGQVNAISLTKHLLSIRDNIDAEVHNKSLFVKACEEITKINSSISNNSTIEESHIEVKKEEIQSQISSFDKWKAMAEQADRIPLDMVMEFMGANNNEDGQAGKWKVWATGDNVQITGNTQWFSWKAQKGGHGAISLLKFHLSTTLNIDDRVPENNKFLYKESIKQLVKEFSDDFEDISNYDFGADVVYKEPFSMPHVIDFKINQVRNYLNTKRGLPLWVINKQISEGLLFAGFPSDWKEEPNLKNPQKLSDDKVWATFLSINGEAAEMRNISTADQFSKILAKGSNKELGGFLIKSEKNCNEKIVSTLEASIDSMSYHSIYPGRIATSCMGVNFNLAVEAALETLDRPGWKFQFCFDNDLAGNEAATRFKEKMIEEIGISEYVEHINNRTIGYFDLGIRCLKESIKQGKTFYFDVRNNETGKQAVLMFQEQLFKEMPPNEVKSLIAEGKIKYINTCPNFGLIKNIAEEAKTVFDLLNSGKPYYLRIDIDKDEKSDISNNRIAFEEEFKKIANDNLKKFVNEGKIIFNKESIAKDWNEYFIYLKNDPTFKQSLIEQEQTYSNYNQQNLSMKKNRP